MAKKALIIIAQDGFQDLEYEGVQSEFVQGGLDITVASSSGGVCKGKLGSVVGGTQALSAVKTNTYDVVAFIGGPGAEAYARHPEALRIAHEAAAESIPLGAICIAPLILAKARVLDGKRATVWDSGGEQAAILKQYGAEFTGEPVTRDGLIVTANGPEAAREFGRTLVQITRM
jgi:protease I